MADKAATRTWSRTVVQAVLLAFVCAAAGLAVNLSHVAKYFRGEYRLVFAEAQAAEDPPPISLPEAADLFSIGQAIFIDARPAEEYEAGHIAGAKNVPLYDSGSDMIWESLAIPREANIIIYCSGDLCQDSLILARRISRQGWRNVKVYVGGWVEWSAAGLPLEEGR